LSKIIGVVATNTIAYVETIFSNLEEKNIIVPLRNSDDQYRIEAAKVEQIIEPHDNGEQWMKRPFSPIKSDDIALIAFTSGTEGNPKGVKITHNNLAEVVQRLNTVMQVDSSIKEYIGIPVYHSFGLGRCRAVASAGGQFFIPANGFDPFEIAEMLKEEQINAISAVPSLWRILLEQKEVIGVHGQKVKWIEIGSQYMSREEKEALKILFPNANIVQHYGLTEASRTTLLEIHNTVGEQLESVGKTFGDIQVKILENHQIAISGSHVATEYIIEGQSVNLKDENGWFITNDLGEIKDGDLYYRGRSDDVINFGGIKVSPEQLETKIFPFIKNTKQIAICRKPDPLRGDSFLVAVTSEFKMNKQELYQLILEACQQLNVNAANAISIVEVEELPRTASGKIQRKKLSEQYAEVEGFQFDTEELSSNSKDYVEPSTPAEKMLCEIGKEVLNIDRISVTDNFVALGIDSLLSLKLIFKLKSKGLKDELIKAVLSGSTIKEVAALISSNREPSAPTTEKPHQSKYKLVLHTTEAVNAVRGIAILAIVFNHWIEGFLNKFGEVPKELIHLLRFPGTPIFALAFGLFLSYLYYDYFQKKNFDDGFRIIYSRIPILLLTILLVGLPAYIRIFITGDFSATAFAKATYSIMNYYLFAMLTIPFLLYWLFKFKRPLEMLVILAAVSMGVAIYLQNFSEWAFWQDGWMLLVKLNLVAYYGYFNLLAFSLVGAAIGIFLIGFKYENRQLYTLFAIAIIAILIGVVLDGHHYAFKGFRYFFPQLFFHSGIALLIVVGMLMISQVKAHKGRFLLTIRNVLSTVGILTLPIYILHLYVIPSKELLIYFSMPKLIAFAIPLSIFFLVMWWLAKIIHRTKATI
jgi:acyl-CoA synthetase (AMP-forming)/AMP-acid ligase II/acyl carrier protein